VLTQLAFNASLRAAPPPNIAAASDLQFALAEVAESFRRSAGLNTHLHFHCTAVDCVFEADATGGRFFTRLVRENIRVLDDHESPSRLVASRSQAMQFVRIELVDNQGWRNLHIDHY